MAVRLLLLLMLMLVLAALYGCAQASSFAQRQEQRAATQEAAKDRQPIMKRVQEPTSAQIALQASEESDHHVRRAKAGVVVRAGKNPAVVARAGQSVVRVGAFKSAKGEGADASVPSGEVTLRIAGLKIVLEEGEEHEHSAH
jgi:glucose/arabinose dehydrogenase